MNMNMFMNQMQTIFNTYVTKVLNKSYLIKFNK